jgi:hypothetical protein
MKCDGSHGGDPSGGKVICKSGGRSLIHVSNDGFSCTKSGSRPQSFFFLICAYTMFILRTFRTTLVKYVKFRVTWNSASSRPCIGLCTLRSTESTSTLRSKRPWNYQQDPSNWEPVKNKPWGDPMINSQLKIVCHIRVFVIHSAKSEPQGFPAL